MNKRKAGNLSKSPAFLSLGAPARNFQTTIFSLAESPQKSQQKSQANNGNERYLANSFTGIKVKIMPELAKAALEAKQDKEFSLWCELRAQDYDGSSQLRVDEMVKSFVPWIYSEATFYRVLKLGTGKFWNLWQPNYKYSYAAIRLVSMERVARMFGVDHLSSPRIISQDKFIKRKQKRAWLYSCQLPPESQRANPISRDSLEVKTSVRRRSQQRYDGIAGNRRVANFAVNEMPDGKLVPQLELRPGKSTEYETVRRLGNSYHSMAEKAPRGMSKRVTRKLHKDCSTKGDGRKKQLITRFFRSAQQYLKCRNRHDEPFIRYPFQKSLVKGRVEWIALAY